MDVQALLQGKGRWAQGTLEWFLARVGQLVALDMPPSGAPVMAQAALKEPVELQDLQARGHSPPRARRIHSLADAVEGCETRLQRRERSGSWRESHPEVVPQQLLNVTVFNP